MAREKGDAVNLGASSAGQLESKLGGYGEGSPARGDGASARRSLAQNQGLCSQVFPLMRSITSPRIKCICYLCGRR